MRTERTGLSTLLLGAGLAFAGFATCLGCDSSTPPTPPAPTPPQPETAAEETATSEEAEAAPTNPEETEAAPVNSEETEAAPESDAVTPATPSAEALEARMTTGLELLFVDDVTGTDIDPLGTLDASSGTYAAFKARVEGEMSETLYVVVAAPRASGQHLSAIELGETRFEPGAEGTTALESFDGFRLDHGLVRAEIAFVSSSAEFATDGECQQRAQEATTRQRVTMLCIIGGDCSSLARSLAVVTPGFETDCSGRRGPLHVTPPEAYEVEITVVDSETLRVTRVSGVVPPEMVGEFAIENLGTDIGRMNELLDDE